MSQNNKYAFSDVYTKHFGPELYLKSYYSSPQGADHEGEMLPFFVDTNFILTRQLPDSLDKALDFGCGPVVHLLMPVVDKIKTAYFAEYLADNRDFVNQWIQNAKDAWDWGPFAEKYATLKHDTGGGKAKGIQDIQTELRAKVGGGVMPCDILADNVLANNDDDANMTFDYIATSLCLETACRSLSDYKSAVLKLANLVNQNGFVLQLAGLNESQYQLGEVMIPVLPVTFQQVQEAWNEAGFTILDSRHLPRVHSDLEFGACGVLARKL